MLRLVSVAPRVGGVGNVCDFALVTACTSSESAAPPATTVTCAIDETKKDDGSCAPPGVPPSSSSEAHTIALTGDGQGVSLASAKGVVFDRVWTRCPPGV